MCKCPGYWSSAMPDRCRGVCVFAGSGFYFITRCRGFPRNPPSGLGGKSIHRTAADPTLLVVVWDFARRNHQAFLKVAGNMQATGFTVGVPSAAPRSSPHVCRNSISLRSGFLGTSTSSCQHKSICGCRLQQSSQCARHGQGSRRTTVMAAKGVCYVH